MKWFLLAAFISLLPVTSAVKLQLSLPESVDVMEGESVTLPCSFSSPSTISSDLYITWLTMPTCYIIYDSQLGNPWLGRAEFVGDEEKGDCSLRLLNVARTLSPVFKCYVYCYHCGRDNWKVEREVKLNVTAAATRSHGETSPITRVHSLRETVVVEVVVVVMGVILASVAVIFFIKRHCRSSGSSPRSRSGDGKADMHGDVEKNGHPLMVNVEKNGHPLMVNVKENGHPLMVNVKKNGHPLIMVNGHNGDNGDKDTDAV